MHRDWVLAGRDSPYREAAVYFFAVHWGFVFCGAALVEYNFLKADFLMFACQNALAETWAVYPAVDFAVEGAVYMLAGWLLLVPIIRIVVSFVLDFSCFTPIINAFAMFLEDKQNGLFYSGVTAADCFRRR